MPIAKLSLAFKLASCPAACDELIAAMSPVGRVARSAAMFEWTRQQIARRITATHGEMSAERLKWMVAMELYGTEPTICRWIERMLEDIPS